MRLYTCATCGQMVFADDTSCTSCGTELAFRPSTLSVERLGDALRCANAEEIGCGWLVEDDGPLCRSCRLTEVRPPAEDAAGVAAWGLAETFKRQLVAQLLELGLDLEGLTFHLRSSSHEPVTTGHADGVVTIDVQEADDATRARMRQRMGEPYRTMLGHFRHEVGHWLWAELVDGTDRLDGFRLLFGDEQADYAAALEAHYDSPDPDAWDDAYVSVYATAHPWEDFAETVAHYLHIRDTMQTAAEFGVSVQGRHDALHSDPAAVGVPDDIKALVAAWLPLTYSLNAINRSMGRDPLYPFVLSPTVIDKLGWVHDLFAASGRRAAAPPQHAGRSRGLRGLLRR